MKTLKKYTFILLTAVVSMIFMTACSSDEPSPDTPTPEGETHRTLIIYMAADNSLSPNSRDNLADITKAVKNGGLQGGRIILYYDYPNGTPYLAEADKVSGEMVMIKEYDNNVSCLDEGRMRSVIKDAMSVAPAKDYGLILWSHGSGWINESDSRSSKQSGAVQPYSFGQDLSPVSQRMSVPTLAKALSDFHFSFIYFDCCFMSTIETVYELRNTADYIISSPTELPVEGMPYLSNIPEMMKEKVDPIKLAQNTLNYYLSGQASLPWCTISVVNTKYLEELKEVTRQIMETGAVNEGSYDPIAYYRQAVPSYTWDMWDMINNLPVDRSLIEDWNQSYAKTVEYYGHSDICYYMPMTGTHGLGTYYHSQRTAYLLDQYGYKDLLWWKDVVSKNPTINP